MKQATYAAPLVATAKKTAKGRKVTLEVYVYPEGHGYIGKGDLKKVVGNSEQASDLFSAIWEGLR